MSPIPDRVIREKERRYLTGVSNTTWWRLEKAGLAPKGFKLGAAAKGWTLNSIEEWIKSRKEGQPW
ncbi:helix-turn-helix transcriptional regulator [Kordiimonas pumila]